MSLTGFAPPPKPLAKLFERQRRKSIPAHVHLQPGSGRAECVEYDPKSSLPRVSALGAAKVQTLIRPIERE